MRIEDVLLARRPGRIVDVIERMRAIEDALPRNDGVVWFTRLYRRVTEAVGEAAQPGSFGDVRFLRRLDVVFANLFFDALRHHVVGDGTVPRAWAPLFDARSRRGIAPLQFALAGMNAHINRDLPVALVETCRAAGVEPQHGTPQYRDFTSINELLERTEAEVKAWFATGFVGVVEEALGDVDDVVAMWNVGRAREAAWTNGEVLWALRPLPRARTRFLASLDRMVGFAGRGLLRPLRVP